MKIGFIGFGKMGKALAHGCSNHTLLVYDPNYTPDGLKAKRVEHLHELVDGSELIVIAVKPQVIEGVLSELSPLNTKGKTFVSIVAGVTTERIEGAVVGKVIRAMPNLGCAVGKGAIAVAKGASATDEDLRMAIEFFESSGTVYVVEERFLDLITAYTGAGPAYLALIFKLFVESAREKGLDGTLARAMFLQTLQGTATLLTHYDEDQIIRMVATPGGVTEQGLAILSGAKPLIIGALEKGTQKSKELG